MEYVGVKNDKCDTGEPKGHVLETENLELATFS